MTPLLAALRRLVRRHRRPLAAVLAALSVVLTVSVLRAPTPTPPTSAAIADPSRLRAGELAVPVHLTSAAIAATLDAGDVIDLVLPATATAVARARVLSTPAAGSVLGSAASSVVMVAVAQDRALRVAVSPEDGYSVVIHPAPR